MAELHLPVAAEVRQYLLTCDGSTGRYRATAGML